VPLIMNCLDKPQQVCVGGNYFAFKAGQIREIHNQDIANHIARSCAWQGMVAVGDGGVDPESGEEFHGMAWTQTEEGKAEVAAKKEQGIDNYCNHLREIAGNLNSIRQDMARKNIQGEPYAFLGRNSGELKALEELAYYQKKGQDSGEAEVKRIKQLERELGTAPALPRK
jgi:hypothetical protein